MTQRTVMPTAAHPKRTSIRRIALASFAGTTIEWYDFFLYGTAAALVFNKVFFPTFAPLTGTLAAYGTYAVGFIARPLGGVVIGHYGDRIGRKSMLVLTLVLMGAATFLIGLLPTYDQVGPWAAVALVALRIIQGFGVGGEWGGAVLMAVEHGTVNPRVWHLPNLPELAVMCYSLTLELQGNFDEACLSLEKALAGRENSDRLRRRLIELHIKQNKRQEALAEIDRLPMAQEPGGIPNRDAANPIDWP